MIGLKRGIVELADHDPEWEKLAADTIQQLWGILDDVAVDIQHIGSTAITSIKAKPIIDITVAVRDFDKVMMLASILKEKGFIFRKREDHDDESLLFACGDYSKSNGIITHFIHVVKSDSAGLKNYINFRDYMNTHFDEAKAYEALKLKLMNENPIDPGREKYLARKKDFINEKLMLAQIWNDFNRKFTKIELITKGWSQDKKYCVTKADGIKYLLRISPVARYETRKLLFEMLKQVDALDIPMCQPIEFGICTDGVYSLQSWIDGEDLEEVLPLLYETEQYVLGLKSGEIIRQMHTIPAPDSQEEWETRFNRKTDMKIQKYNECGLRFEGDEYVLNYIKQNRHLLKNRMQCFQHGDYHVGNMMLEKGELKIIDFDRYDFGDPWEEFNRIVWCAQKSPHFATGQLRGYFGGEPPIEFFKLLAFYISSNTLSSIYWALDFDNIELETMINQAKDVLSWYDNMKNPVPIWYLKNFYIQYADGVPFKLKSPFDFSFLSKYGTVFTIFDDQDSGNICFGMQADDGKRYFIKFAGAPTDRANVGAEEAIINLKRTVQIYKDLAHPCLIKLIDAEEIGSGFAMIFEWVDAECMGKMYPLSRNKFMQMPLKTKQQIFDDILNFHNHISKQEYIAIDFYDGSIMYDFKNEKTVICDIDFYTKKPYKNPIGRMWGSSRFMSPEEYVLGAEIDEITNVYNMGATAFALFGDECDRCIEKWKFGKELFDVTKKAVSDDRNMRQQSIQSLIEEWRSAKNEPN